MSCCSNPVKNSMTCFRMLTKTIQYLDGLYEKASKEKKKNLKKYLLFITASVMSLSKEIKIRTRWFNSGLIKRKDQEAATSVSLCCPSSRGIPNSSFRITSFSDKGLSVWRMPSASNRGKGKFLLLA